MCKSHYERWRRYGNPTAHQQQLPVAPLLDPQIRQRINRIRRFDPGRWRTIYRLYYRALERGWLTPDQADQLAVHVLGEHPSLIWPEWNRP